MCCGALLNTDYRVGIAQKDTLGVDYSPSQRSRHILEIDETVKHGLLLFKKIYSWQSFTPFHISEKLSRWWLAQSACHAVALSSWWSLIPEPRTFHNPAIN